MGWKFGVFAIRHDYSADVSPLWSDVFGLPRVATGEKVTVDRALSVDTVFDTKVLVHGGVTLVLDHLLPYDCASEADQAHTELDVALAGASRMHDILVAIFDGTTSTYFLALFSGGTRVRLRTVLSGEIELDRGAPLAGEEAGMDDESVVFGALEAFAGFDLADLSFDETVLVEVYRDPTEH